MLAAAVRIDAGAEANVRAVVVIDDAARAVLEKLRGGRRIFHRVPIRVPFDPNFLEAIGRIVGCAPAMDRMRSVHGVIILPCHVKQTEFFLSTRSECWQWEN